MARGIKNAAKTKPILGSNKYSKVKITIIVIPIIMNKSLSNILDLARIFLSLEI